MKYITLLVFVIATISCSCSKNTVSNNNQPPSNLKLSTTVSTDNSGNVTFTATADNATSYEFDFGNGIFQSSSTGTVTYKYPASGNYTVKVTAKSASGLTLTRTSDIAVAVSMALVWSDEFDVAGAPNQSKWSYELGAGGWGNAEQQYYTNRSDNSVVSNGTLKIIAKKEAYSGSNYTSARLITKGKFDFKYGKVEVRAKLPTGVGTWPAIWMLGSNVSTAGWPACGEIDIMEHVGAQQNKIYGTLHYPGRFGGNADGGTTNIATASTDFHRYGVEWTPSIIKFSVDDVVFFSYNNSASSPFNANFFIILNFAMGGNFGGTIDPAFTSAQLEVDYVRVYQ